MLDTAAVRDGYDRWSVVYDHDANPLPALEEPVVRAAAGRVEGLTALDLGCGTGRHTAWLAESGARVTAVDFSAGMLAVAKEKTAGHPVQFVQHDLNERLPFDGAFDLVVSGLVLEHLTDLSHFFGEVGRLLKPGAHAVVSAMHPAMHLKGSKARFTDPESGEVIEPGSADHSIAACLTAAIGAGLRLDRISEHAPDAAFARRFPRSEKYVGWPMLVVYAFSHAD